MEMRDITPQIGEVAKRYDYHEPPSFLVSLQDWIAWALRAVSDFLASFKIIIPGLADTSTVSSIMQLLLYLAGIIAAAAVMYLVWTRLGYLNKQTQLARGGSSITQSLLDSNGWRAESESFAQRSQWKDACRAIYFSTLRLLSERNIADFSPSRTNYEYWYVLADYPTLQIAFRELASRVESIWFGGRIPEQSDYEYCVSKVNMLAQEAEHLAENRQSKVLR
jgi:hypothetical protein